jgi:hypothetical protein
MLVPVQLVKISEVGVVGEVHSHTPTIGQHTIGRQVVGCRQCWRSGTDDANDDTRALVVQHSKCVSMNVCVHDTIRTRYGR